MIPAYNAALLAASLALVLCSFGNARTGSEGWAVIAAVTAALALFLGLTA